MQKTAYYTVVDTGYGCYVKFMAPPDYVAQEDKEICDDAGEASQEFLKLHPGAQYLGSASFNHKARKLEGQRAVDRARLEAWNGK
jgi:hypothetical protein